MKKFIILFFCIGYSLFSFAQDLKMWYDQAANRFEAALPLGNGRIGMMVYGNVADELLNLNEESLWGGIPTNTNTTPDAPSFLPKVRDLLFAENWGEASKMLRNIQGPNSQSFIPMGDLVIHQKFLSDKQATDYRRDLDIERAVASTRFNVDTITYMREYFVSAPAQVAVVHLTASAPKSINFTVDASTQFEYANIVSCGNDEFVLRGQAPYSVNSDRRGFPLEYVGPNGEKGMRYQFRVKAISSDGMITTTPALSVKNATEVTLIISAATSFNGYDHRPDIEGKDEEQIASDYLQSAVSISYKSLLAEHEADYKKYFERLTLNLYPDTIPAQPTDVRLKQYAKGVVDPALEALYFQFGRYLLISSSRPGGIAANLQGIWNINQRPSWGSNFTTNINLEMNYWGADMLNLSELTEPLVHQIQNLSVTGKEIARNFYNMNGWAVHHNSDIWAHANPVGHKKGDPKWANWSLGSPWLSQHLFEHYRFTNDKIFLRDTAYPLMKGAADFCLDWLVEYNGQLITAPSTSPENVFIDENGKKGVVTIGSAMDAEIIANLLNNLIEASNILRTDDSLRNVWQNTLLRLRPLQIGKNGNLIEWYKDWQDEDPQHRHVSHLFALHPGREISPLTTPELANACRKTLEIRGDGGTGWSKAWKINFWARLLDGDHAYKMYRELLSSSTLPNLFDTHPPFQIDGNFGSIAGVGEMLVQSQLNEIHILPALPEVWKKGEVKGICARGGFTLDITWDDHKLKSAVLLSKHGNICTIRTTTPIKIKGTSVASKKAGDYYLTTFKTKIGQRYLILSK